jgi:uncharacterized protein (DUF1330 family)
VTIYAIAQLRFTDRVTYDRYRARFMEVFRSHRGTLLAVDESPQVVEGDRHWEKVVLMSFADQAAFRGWADSPEYQQIPKDRHARADTVVLLAKGLA